MLSAIGFIQTLNAWKAPTTVLTAIQEFNKVDEFVADGTRLSDFLFMPC